MHGYADARSGREAFGVSCRPAQLQGVDLFFVLLFTVVDNVVEHDIVGPAHVERIIGRTEERPVVLGGFPVGIFLQVVVVVADDAVNGNSERCELLLYAGKQLGRIPDDVAQQDGSLLHSLCFLGGGFGLQDGNDLRTEPLEMLLGLGLRVGDGQQFVSLSGRRPRPQFKVVTFRRRGVGQVKLRHTLLRRRNVARRGYEADEQRFVVGVERKHAFGVAFREGVAVRNGDARHGFSVAFHRALDRAGGSCGNESAEQ